MRFKKRKSGIGAIEAHHERKKEKYKSNPDIDTGRSKYNFHIVMPQTTYLSEIDGRITAAGCRTRKDSVRFIDTIITASPEFFEGKKREDVKAYFQTAVDFLIKKIGKGNIFSAVVHMDESSPHMHLCFTPITRDGRLTAKEIIGNKVHLTKWQDSFWSHMVKSYPDLERGESASVTGRRHIPTRVFKQAIQLTKQKEAIQVILDGITPLNASKKRDEVVSMLQQFWPHMESFETQVGKYKREFTRLEKVNAVLAKKAKSAEKASIGKQMAGAKLLSDFMELQRFVDSLPEEIRREAQEQLRSNKNLDRGGR